jgi:hypothetical protein
MEIEMQNKTKDLAVPQIGSLSGASFEDMQKEHYSVLHHCRKVIDALSKSHPRVEDYVHNKSPMDVFRKACEQHLERRLAVEGIVFEIDRVIRKIEDQTPVDG